MRSGSPFRARAFRRAARRLHASCAERAPLVKASAGHTGTLVSINFHCTLRMRIHHACFADCSTSWMQRQQSASPLACSSNEQWQACGSARHSDRTLFTPLPPFTGSRTHMELQTVAVAVFAVVAIGPCMEMFICTRHPHRIEDGTDVCLDLLLFRKRAVPPEMPLKSILSGLFLHKRQQSIYILRIQAFRVLSFVCAKQPPATCHVHGASSCGLQSHAASKPRENMFI